MEVNASEGFQSCVFLHRFSITVDSRLISRASFWSCSINRRCSMCRELWEVRSRSSSLETSLWAQAAIRSVLRCSFSWIADAICSNSEPMEAICISWSCCSAWNFWFSASSVSFFAHCTRKDCCCQRSSEVCIFRNSLPISCRAASFSSCLWASCSCRLYARMFSCMASISGFSGMSQMFSVMNFWMSTIGRNDTAFFIMRVICSLWTFHFASMFVRYCFCVS